MTDIIIDGRTRVEWVSGENTISNPAAPTLAQLAAGMRISQWMPKAGISGFMANTAAVDAAGIESRHDDERAGRVNHSGSILRLKKQTDPDIAYTTLVLGVLGFVIIRRYIIAIDAFVANQEISVFPVECGEVRHLEPEDNTMGRYEVPVYMRKEPVVRALVAA